MVSGPASCPAALSSPRSLTIRCWERGLRPLVGLRGDEPVAFEDPPHGGDRRHLVDLAPEVMGDGFRAGVMSGCAQLAAELDDQVLGTRPSAACGAAG